MCERDGEVPAGGNTSVVRKVGDTVRRSAGPWTPLIHDLLRHLQREGFELAPEPLGLDSSGREILRYEPGDTVAERCPWPAWAWSGAQHEIVCHNDFAPYNVVVRDGRLVALLDWDFASPGTPLWELAFMAWQWVPLHHRRLSESLGAPEPSELARRLRLLCDSYGLQDRSALIGTVVHRVQSSRDGIIRWAAAGDPAFMRLLDNGHADDMAMTLDSIAHARSELSRAISPA